MAETFDLLVRNGTLVSGTGRTAADIGVRDGRIVALASPLAGESAAELDAAGLLVLPGVIDAHVHFRQPGLEQAEDWSSGSRAAVMGGVTTVLEMPNTVPPTATVADVRHKLGLAGLAAHCDFGIFGLLGPDPAAVVELAGSGLVVGLKAFLGPTTGALAAPTDEQLRAGLIAARAAGLRVGFHAEDADVVARATADLRAAGRRDPLAHLAGRPMAAEEAAIERIGRLALDTRAAVHVAHLASIEGLAAVDRWQRRGADLTCEVTPHHALLGVDVYDRFGGLAKVNPPIRGEPHAAALLRALAAGRVDCLASDHAPHPAADKADDDIWAVAAGFAGTQVLLPLLLTEAAAGRITLEALVGATAEGPARAWRLWPAKGALQPGSDADLVLVDPARAGVIRASELHGRNNHGPWEGRPTVGAAVATVVRGRIVMRDGELLGQPGWGRSVVPGATIGS